MLESFLSPAGPISLAQRHHLFLVVALTMIAVLPVIVLVPWILWRYRFSNRNANYMPDWERSKPFEILNWGVPFAIIAVLSVLLWRSTVALDPYRPLENGRPLSVQVIGLDWKWLFLYPDQGIATVGELAFPADRPVSLTLTSDTVMQSFAIPALAGQIYTMPGMTTELHFAADAPGVFKGKNTQYNGAGFHGQTFRAVAMTDSDFAAWVQQIHDGAPGLSDASYAQLARRGTAEQAQTALSMGDLPAGTLRFRLQNTSLFSSVLSRYRSGRPITPELQPGSPGYRPQRTVVKP